MNKNIELEEYYSNLIKTTKGPERGWAYTSLSYSRRGFYTPDELIDLAIANEIIMDIPFVKIKRSTQIGKGCIINGNTCIEGEDVSIGESCILENTHITSSQVVIGKSNRLVGEMDLGNINIGDNNFINNLRGKNTGYITIGDDNRISEVVVNNIAPKITIGSKNELHKGLSINGIFPKGNIFIGNNNSLGRDGGGVVSNSYRYNKKWWGDVIVGSFVETTRGAEILGFSVVGISLNKQEEDFLRKCLIDGPLDSLSNWINTVDIEKKLPTDPDSYSVRLFGTTQVKISCLTKRVQIKDQSRIHNSYLENIIIPERSVFYFVNVHNDNAQFDITTPDIVIEKKTISEKMDWKQFVTKTDSPGYRGDEQTFYST